MEPPRADRILSGQTSGGDAPPGVSLVLSFRPEKKEPRREGSKKTWRSASDGSPLSFSFFFPPFFFPKKEKEKGARAIRQHPPHPQTNQPGLNR
jgi:hypothetical protein